MTKILRPVSNLERYYIARQNVNFYNNISFTVRYRWDELHQLNPIIDPLLNHPTDQVKELILQILYPSLKKLILKQPSLSISLKGTKTSQPLFILLSQIDLSDLINFTVISDEKDLINVFEREHDVAFDQESETKPLWRIMIGIYDVGTNSDENPRTRSDYDFCVMFCWHHCIGDGKSAYAIHNTFIESINSTLQERNPSESIISIPDTLQICAPLEERIDVRPTIPHLLKEAFMELVLPSFLKKSLLPDYWAGDTHSKDISDYLTKVLLYSLEKNDMEKLLLIVKQNKTTIQAVLHTVILFSSYHHLNDDKPVRITSPLSLRPYATPPISSNDMGDYVSEFTFDYQFPVEKSTIDFWELCHQYKSKLNDNILTSVQHVGMLNYLSKDNKSWEDFYKQKLIGLPMGRGYSIELNNWGKYNNLEERSNVNDGWKVIDMFYSQSAQVVGAAITVNSISYDNKLNISITYQKSAVSDKKAKDFGIDIIECLKLIVNDKNISLK